MSSIPVRMSRWLWPVLFLVVAGGLARRRFRRRSVRGDVALVTGGSRGLGLLIAEELIRYGVRLVICARDEGELERASTRLQSLGADVKILAADLERTSEVPAVARAAREAFGRIDMLINNAGIMEVGPQENMSDEAFERAMNLHFWAPLHLIREVVPEMKARRDGRIVNISSIGGIIAVPHMLPYSASKFALTGFSEGLCAELAADGIAVTTVCPGLMRTGSVGHALFRGRKEGEHAAFSLGAATPVTSMNARRAARKIVQASLDRRARLVLTWQANIVSILHGIAPGFVTSALGIVNRLLPSPARDAGGRSSPGRVIPSKLPSWLTSLNDRAAERHNET